MYWNIIFGLLSATALVLSVVGHFVEFWLPLGRVKQKEEENEQLRKEKSEIRERYNALRIRVSFLEMKLTATIDDLTAERKKSAQLQRTGGADNGSAYRELRALVLRELHPDASPNDAKLERIVRSELFKDIWPQVQSLDQGK